MGNGIWDARIEATMPSLKQKFGFRLQEAPLALILFLRSSYQIVHTISVFSISDSRDSAIPAASSYHRWILKHRHHLGQSSSILSYYVVASSICDASLTVRKSLRTTLHHSILSTISKFRCHLIASSSSSKPWFSSLFTLPATFRS